MVQKPQPILKNEENPPQLPLFASLSENLDKVREILGESNDIVIREFKLGTVGIKAALLYVDFSLIKPWSANTCCLQ